MYRVCFYCQYITSIFSRYTLAGVNAVKEVQVTGDMTDCTPKNGPLEKQRQLMPNSTICHPGVSLHPSRAGGPNSPLHPALRGVQQTPPCLAGSPPFIIPARDRRGI